MKVVDENKRLFIKAVKAFPPSVQQELESLGKNGGVLEEQSVTWLLQKLDIDVRQLMMDLLPLAAAYARVPVSGFYVGAVARGLGDPGCLYFGANMEFGGQALSFCVHGEQSAFTNAWIHGEQGLQALGINAAPCGYCRQFLYELAGGQELEILLSQKDGKYPVVNKLAGLLPQAFNPGDLGIKSHLMKLQYHDLTLHEPPDDLTAAALKAANGSYAPYSHNYAGVAIKGSDNRIYTGRCAENAAYNPGMSPLESALTFMNMNGNINVPIDILDAVLVEKQSVISQADASRVVLSAVTDIPLRYYKTVPG